MQDSENNTLTRLFQLEIAAAAVNGAMYVSISAHGGRLEGKKEKQHLECSDNDFTRTTI